MIEPLKRSLRIQSQAYILILIETIIKKALKLKLVMLEYQNIQIF